MKERIYVNEHRVENWTSDLAALRDSLSGKPELFTEERVPIMEAQGYRKLMLLEAELWWRKPQPSGRHCAFRVKG